jgi:plasmid stabilization system protein ParE
MFKLVITDLAEGDIQQAYDWWRDRRSSEQAARWYERIQPAIGTLRKMADRCPHSPETDLHPLGLRELYFGLGRRPSHRIVFTIDGTTVTVLRVRHSAQRPLTADDLS